MKKEIFYEIEIPKGVEATLEDTTLIVKGEAGENKRTFKIPGIVLELKEGKIRIGNKKATKREKKIIHTTKSHIENMLRGVQKKFEYQLKICSSHFPMNVETQGKEIIIKNFLGEKIPRKSVITEGSEVEINGDIITVKSVDKELAGQTAANFEIATKIRKKDRRIFQDGIFIINKAGREI